MNRSADITSLQGASAAVARAAALRNSRFTSTAVSSSALKRKRTVLSDDDSDNESPDAQLARALQQEEDEAASAMAVDELNAIPNRKPRKAQKILPKSAYVADSEEDSSDLLLLSSNKKPKVELSASKSNSVSFKASVKSEILETDDSDDDLEFLASDSSVDQKPIAATRRRMPPFKRIGRVVAQAKRPQASATNSLQRRESIASTASSALSELNLDNSDSDLSIDSDMLPIDGDDFSTSDDGSDGGLPTVPTIPRGIRARARRGARQLLGHMEDRQTRRQKKERARLETHHPELHTMWQDLENLPKIGKVKIEQPKNITRELKPFQLEGVAWMKAMENTEWGGGLLGDEMGMGKTIQAVSLIMSDFPAPQPTLVLIPPVALMQWQQEIEAYTDGTLKTFVYHGTNKNTKGITEKDLRKYNVILMSYNSLESMYRKQEKGFKRKEGIHKEKSLIHKIHFHRVILDEAHNIKVISLHVQFRISHLTVADSYYWLRQGMFCPEGISQVVLVWNPSSEPNRRIFLARSFPGYSTICLLLLQAV